MARPNIYEYMDYRVYLDDLFRFHKQKDSFFSYRYFSGKAGFASPNFLKLVIENKRNLTSTSIAKVAKGFGLNKQERVFFEHMVFMNQAKDHEEQHHYLQEMMSVNGYLKVRLLEKKSFEYFSNWFNPAIREVVMLGKQAAVPEEIADRLLPKIEVQKARKALELLISLGLIYKNKDGLWEQSDPILTTGPEVRSLAVTRYHRAAIQLGSEALDRFAAHERDISALTLRVSSDSMAALKERIACFRRELLEFALNEKDPDQVIQINFQVFPLTKKA